ncbi:MAG: hypothetical protein DMG51_06530 [Acidobacteria bacterium]|nr:MAG: hypothetical protein DMG51_06530 [Acidobacteriota bacterium]
MTRVSADLLRHYERIEILPPPSRSSNGYRLYAPQMVERVRAVRHAVSRGLSLAELSRIFAVSAIEAQANDAQDTASRDGAHRNHVCGGRVFGANADPWAESAGDAGDEAASRYHSMWRTGSAERACASTTNNAEALQAVHQFLRFQIAAHQTGDATEITKVP